MQQRSLGRLWPVSTLTLGGGGLGWAAPGIAGEEGYDPGRVGGFLRGRRVVDPGLTP